MEQFDVLGIGNALVDILVHAEDDLLRRESMIKGSMQLVDAATAAALYKRLPPGVEVSGGSAGNTMAGIASLGGRGAYIGKIADDQLGQVFSHDMRSAGIHFATAPASSAAPTGRCLIIVTPDAQRTMHTHLGAGLELTPGDIDHAVVSSAQVTYLEGYLWDPPLAKQAFLEAARIAHEAGNRVSLTLSDTFCVDRHRSEFIDLIDGHIDVLFANEAELKSLYETESFEASVDALRGRCEVAAVTRSAKGSIILAGDDTYEIAAVPVARVVDTTGAGDLYAAGFLFGLTQGLDLRSCGEIASIAAAEVISHVGARPESPLADLVGSILNAPGRR